MQCPECETIISWEWLEEEAIKANETFYCPHCDIPLRYMIDEGTYYGAQHITIEVVDE